MCLFLLLRHNKFIRLSPETRIESRLEKYRDGMHDRGNDSLPRAVRVRALTFFYLMPKNMACLFSLFRFFSFERGGNHMLGNCSIPGFTNIHSRRNFELSLRYRVPGKASLSSEVISSSKSAYIRKHTHGRPELRLQWYFGRFVRCQVRRMSLSRK